MRCFYCSTLSFKIICNICKNKLLINEIERREINGLEVISFFKFSTINKLIYTKYYPHGYRIYQALADMTLKPFIKNFIKIDDREIYIIGIDEYVKKHFAHVAILTRAMKMKNVIPLHSSLMATNRVQYAGRDLQFRLDNPKKFIYKGKSNIDAILIDDVITTGSTLVEAEQLLTSHGVNVLFALTLSYLD